MQRRARPDHRLSAERRRSPRRHPHPPRREGQLPRRRAARWGRSARPARVVARRAARCGLRCAVRPCDSIGHPHPHRRRHRCLRRRSAHRRCSCFGVLWCRRLSRMAPCRPRACRPGGSRPRANLSTRACLAPHRMQALGPGRRRVEQLPRPHRPRPSLPDRSGQGRHRLHRRRQSPRLRSLRRRLRPCLHRRTRPRSSRPRRHRRLHPRSRCPDRRSPR